MSSAIIIQRPATRRKLARSTEVRLEPRLISRPASHVPEVEADPVLDDIYRVRRAGETLGFVQVAGHVYVTLEGAVYNTSVEVAQTLDLDSAVSRLTLSAD